jgi:hypothetical protein
VFIKVVRHMPGQMIRESKGIEDVTARIMLKIVVVQFVVTVL